MRVQREKIQNGWKKDKRFEGEGGVRALHWQKEARWGRLSSGGIPAGGVHSAGKSGISKKSRDAAGSSKSRKGE